MARDKLGWTKGSSPSTLLSGKKWITKPQEIAERLNLDYVTRNNNLSNNIPDNGIDPMINYKRVIKTPTKKLYFQTINMSDLRKMINKIRPTASTGIDDISVKTLKIYINVLEPLLLKLINQVIITTKKSQKLSKPQKSPQC